MNVVQSIQHSSENSMKFFDQKEFKNYSFPLSFFVFVCLLLTEILIKIISFFFASATKVKNIFVVAWKSQNNFKIHLFLLETF